MSAFDTLRNNPSIRSITSKLNTIGEKLSEDDLIRIDWRSICLVVICTLLFGLNVLFKTSGSSVKEWNSFVRGDSTKQQIIGQSRFIRFDEWCMHTPMLISQNLNGFHAENPALGAERSALLMSLPVKAFPSILRPHLWGYFIFPLETAYSFAWNYKTYGMFLAVFFLLMLLSRNNFWMSVAGSLWLSFSSFIQWWYSTPEPEMIMAVSLLFIFFIYVLYARRLWAIVLSGLGLALFATAFLLFFYPPHQIPLAYFMAFVLAGYLMTRHSSEAFAQLRIVKLLVIVGVLSLLGYSAMSFLSQAQQTISIMTQTEYPGSRVSVGGEVSLTQYFGGFFDLFFSEKHFPEAWMNVCEASNFILLYPVVIAAMIIAALRKQRVDKLQLMIVLYLIFLTVWMVVGYPEFIAKLTLLNRVKENRAFIGIGFASIVLVMLFLSRSAASQHSAPTEGVESDADTRSTKKKKKGSSKQSVASRSTGAFDSVAALQSLGALVLLLIYGFTLNTELQKFFSSTQIVGASLLFGVLSYLLVAKHRALFAGGIVGVVMMSNFMVNPIMFGLSPILDKELMKTVRDISTKDPDAKWLYYGSNIAANYFIAAGVNVINGSKFAPDLALMKIIDPEGKNMSVYNRFAQIHVMPNDSARFRGDVRFTLDNMDGYSLFINPDAPQLKAGGVKYIASGILPMREQVSVLEPLYEKQLSRMWFYRLKDSGVVTRKNLLSSLNFIPALDRFRVGDIKINSNDEHDAFIISGVAYDALTNDVAGGVVLDLNGETFEAEYGLINNNVSDPRYRNSAFRITLPFVYTGRGHSDFKLRVLTKDKKAYGNVNQGFGVDIN